MNPYHELGVEPDADLDAINAAYRRAARAAHPDAGGTTEQFDRLAQAVAILRDPDRRARFDRDGKTDAAPDPRNAIVEAFVQNFQAAMLETHAPTMVDLIAATIKRIRRVEERIAGERSQGQAERTKLVDAIGRLTHNGDGPDVLSGALQQALAGIDRALALMDEQSTILADARKMAGEYEWRRDQPEFAGFETFSGTSGVWHGAR